MATVRQYVFALRFLVPGIVCIFIGLFFLTSPNDKLLGVGIIALGAFCTAVGVWLLKMIRAEPKTSSSPTALRQNSPPQLPQIQIPPILEPGMPPAAVPPKRSLPVAKPLSPPGVPQGQVLPKPAAPKPPPSRPAPVTEMPQIQVTPPKKPQ